MSARSIAIILWAALAATAVGSSERGAMADMASRLYIDGDETYTMKAGEPSEWVFEIFNPLSPEPFHHFHPMHGKEVHAFVISEDFESFSHIHPAEAGHHLGLFSININAPTTDPDSLDTEHAVTRSGRYFVYTESMPMTERMTVLGLDVVATGEPRPPIQPLVETAVDASGAMVLLHEDYRLRVTHEELPHPGTFIIIVHVHLERFDAAAGGFVPVMDIEPWLLSYAHAVMLSSEGRGAAEKRLLHLHAAWPIVDDPASGSGPDLDLAADTHTPPREGLYKTWIQFKHAGKVHTVPLAFQVTKPEF